MQEVKELIYKIDVDDSINNSEKDVEASRYRALWRAVIMQAILDSVNNSSRTEEKLAKSQSYSWLTNISEDLIIVCSMAEYTASYIKKKSLEIISKHNKKVNVFCYNNKNKKPSTDKDNGQK